MAPGTTCEALTPEALSGMLDEYYAQRGWTEHGVPTPETLHRLELGELVGE